MVEIKRTHLVAGDLNCPTGFNHLLDESIPEPRRSGVDFGKVKRAVCFWVEQSAYIGRLLSQKLDDIASIAQVDSGADGESVAA